MKPEKRMNEGNRKVDFFLFSSLSAILLLAPFLFGAVYPWVSMSLTAGIFFAAFFQPRLYQELHFLPRFLFWGFLILIVFIFVQGLFYSINRYETYFEFLKWLGFAILFLLVQRTHLSQVQKLFVVFILIGVVESAYALIQLALPVERVLWTKKVFHQDYATGTYFNRNHLAGFLQLVLGVHLGWILVCVQRKKRSRALLAVLLFALSFFAFIKTGSRMGFISFAAALFLMTFFLKSFSWKIKVVLSVFLFLLLCGMLFGTREIISERFHESYASLQTWDGGRLIAWKDSMHLIRRFAIWGTGLGNYDWAFPYFQSPKLLLGWDHAHNDYIELAAELGLPAFGILMLVWIAFFARLFSELQSMAKENFFLLWGCLVAMIAFALHGLTDFNGAIFANALSFVFVAGGAYRLTTGDS